MRIPGAPVLGPLGLVLALLAALVAFVTAMEYDPDGAAFLDRATVGYATVDTVEPIDDGRSRATVTFDDGREATTVFDPQRWPTVAPGSWVEVAADGSEAHLRADLPDVPRTATGFVVAAVMYAIAAAGVAADPASLYPTAQRRPAIGDDRDR